MVKSAKLFIVVLIGFIASTSIVFAQTADQNAYARFMRTGSEQMKAGDYQAARDSFEQALTYNDSESEGHLGLGLAYFHLRDDKYAERELSKAVELNPKASIAYQFLGELYYRKDDLETAVSYWEKAVEVNPSATDLRTRLDRIRKEHKAEKDFNRDVTSHFLIKYEGREKIEAGRIVLRILEDAYSEVGRSLSYYPEQEIQVILYSGQQFKEVTEAPGWSGGLFDGKIRLPIGGIEKETPVLRSILLHEYTHAVVRAITRRCPTWLNEGLAQYFEGRQIDPRQQEALKKLVQAGKLPSLTNLEGSFMGLGSSQAQTAYLISLSAVRSMIDSFGMYRVKDVLDELARGADIGKAISIGLMVSYEEFERGWKRSLE
ncbi:MAG: tetratricopeptide repeat protein [Nitrospirae bacterium]|nr:tetratricopeptide repeat protein [Nitrospirota bacterium]